MSIFFRTDDEGNNGWWTFSSKTDPRWNFSGRGFIVVSCGMDDAAKKALEAKKKELGDPPKDLVYSCMKD